MATRSSRKVSHTSKPAAQTHIPARSNSSSEDKIGQRPRKDKGKGREQSSEEDSIGEEREHHSLKISEGEYQDINDGTQDSEEEGEREKSPVFHHQIFNQLVAYASDNGRLTYVNEEPSTGADEHDVSAFRKSQATWTRAFAHRPANLSLWKAPDPRNSPDYELGAMTWNGHVVLDYHGDPIRAFKHLPLAISSGVDGYWVESWSRADERLKLADIVARICTKPLGRKRVPRINERVLATRTRQFREHAGLISWKAVPGRDAAIAYFHSLHSEAQITHNLAVQRDLTAAEIANYVWIIMDKTMPSNSSSITSRVQRIKSTQHSARRNFPDGEFEPGARRNHDAGDLFDDLSEDGEGNDSEGLSEGAPGDAPDTGAPRLSNRPPPARTLGMTLRSARVRPPAASMIDTSESGSSSSGEDETSRGINGTMATQRNEAMDLTGLSNVDGQRQEDLNDRLSDVSLYSDPEDPNDVRNQAPTTVEEVETLQEALLWTLTDFHDLSGYVPDQPDPSTNYLSQWATLQADFNYVWWELGHDDPAPLLRGLDRWEGSIADWREAALARTDRVIAEEEVFGRPLED